MSKILTICPSTNRRQMLQNMINSFFETATPANDLCIVIKPGDPIPLVKFRPLFHNGTVTQCINYAYSEYPNYDFYHIVNDDALYQTPQWDEKFVKLLSDHGPGICYGNDLFQGVNLCTFPFISGALVRALGWLQWPYLNRFFGDTIWHTLGTKCNCLFYEPEVIIEHLHYYAGKSSQVPDNTHYGCDQVEFSNWIQVMERDVERIKKVINAKAN